MDNKSFRGIFKRRNYNSESNIFIETQFSRSKIYFLCYLIFMCKIYDFKSYVFIQSKFSFKIFLNSFNYFICLKLFIFYIFDTNYIISFKKNVYFQNKLKLKKF